MAAAQIDGPMNHPAASSRCIKVLCSTPWERGR